MKNKLSTLILSLLIAFGMWIYVITSVSPGSEETFHNIPVVREGETVLQERGLMITEVSANTVSLKLSGTRKDLAKVNSGNITLKVDLSKIYEPGTHSLQFTASYPGDVASNAFVEEARTPESITFVVEERRNKEVPVEIKWTGSSPEGFLTDKESRALDYPTVTVVGPASVADQIEKAVIEVDLTERRESISENFRYTLCDAEGNPVDAEKITTNVQEIRLDVKIQRLKDLKLVCNVVNGGGATADNVDIALSVDTIRVSGSEAVLDKLGDQLVIATVNLADYPENAELECAINLPEGVTNLTGVTETKVSLTFKGLITKTIVLDEFHSINIPEGMIAEITTQELKVDVRGPAQLMQRLTAGDVRATVDFAAAEPGSFSVRVIITFSEEFAALGVVGPCSVVATISPEE